MSIAFLSRPHSEGRQPALAPQHLAPIPEPPEPLPPPDISDIGSARCYVCRLWKPMSAFHRDRSRRGGRSFRCRACAAECERLRAKPSTHGRAK